MAMTDGSPAEEPAGRPPGGSAERLSLDGMDHDPVIREDPLSRRIVFVAPRRAARPAELGPDAESLAACPFCAGHEHLTPPPVLQAEIDGVWHARIVPNRYPVVEDLPRASGGPADSAHARRRPQAAADPETARGVHEVVVEAPDHLRSILPIPSERWQAVWRLVRDRLAMLSAREDLAWATVFKNAGSRAGASLEHVHSQIVALDFVPPLLMAERVASATREGSFDDLLRRAADDSRIVAECGGLVALVPPAPRQPLECWILPARPEPRFHQAPDESVEALATLTRWFVERLERLAPGADYNWWLHDAAFRGWDPPLGQEGAGGWHWHLEILPRLAALAGFELGTGCHITTLPARKTASLLRGA
jgi:UDPglucose--hexose-1-phosphate uridylyltransferase